MSLRRLFLIALLLSPISAFAVRSMTVVFPHTTSFYPDNEHWMSLNCSIVNPSAVPQRVTMRVYKRTSPAANAVISSAYLEQTIVSNQLLNQYESYLWNQDSGAKVSVNDIPVKLTVEIAGDGGFVVGHCAFTGSREHDSRGNNNAAIRGAIPVPMNGGKPF